MAFTHNRSIGRPYRHYSKCRCRYTKKWVSPERQQSVKYFGCWILSDPRAVLRRLSIIEVLAAFFGNLVHVDLAAPEIERQQSVYRVSTERRPSVNNHGRCILYKLRAVLRDLPINNVLAALMGKRDSNMVTAQFWQWASTEHQWFWVLHRV